jgi:hypothetical protein
MMLRPCLHAHATQARPLDRRPHMGSTGWTAEAWARRPSHLTGQHSSTVHTTVPQQCPLVQTQRQRVPMSLSLSLSLSGLRSTPDTRTTAAVRSEPSTRCTATEVAGPVLPRPVHKIFHRLRATAPTPAAVRHLPSGRARRPCAASLAPVGGGDGEAEADALARTTGEDKPIDGFHHLFMPCGLGSWGTVWGGALEISGNNEANHKAISRRRPWGAGLWPRSHLTTTCAV